MPDFELEKTVTGPVVGIDEAGRGPWAGPVVAGAVIFLDRQLPPELLNGLDDSKKLTPKKREYLYHLLREEEAKGHLCIGIGEASAEEIDRLNILQATFLAMRRAAEKLKVKPQTALIDGNKIPKDFLCEARWVVKGDGRSLSIAAASIAAKVTRDRLMTEFAQKYPYYGFEKNAGYGVKEHVEGLKKYGISPIHRRSFRPIKELAA